MGELPRTKADGTLGLPEGFPYRAAWARAVDPLHIGRVGLAALGVGLAAVALFLAMTFTATPGVLADNPGGLVRSVDKLGFAWRDGIRPGQTVVVMTAADEPGGWQIVTIDGTGMQRISSVANVQAAAERIAIVAMLALVIAAIGLLLSATASPASGPAVAAGVGLAAVPLAVAGDSQVAWLGLMFATLVSGARLAADLDDRRVRALALTAAVAAIGVSVLSRSIDPAATRVPDPLWLLLIGCVVGGGLRWVRQRRTHGQPTSVVGLTVDVVVPAALASLLVITGVSGLVQWQVAAAGALIAILASGSVRGRISEVLDTTWLDGVRRTASISALDEERSRVAADLHDAPLQEIAGVIARLEGVPAVDHERQALRTVSEQLRELVTGLEPPMLDQLGLVPALDHVVAQLTPGPTVTLAVRADAPRPPHAVEVAAYRIAEEALRNAVHHSNASHVVVSGEISSDRISMSVEDDGGGVGQARARGGLALMPARARAVGGKIRCLPGTNGGTVIVFEWRAG